MVPIFNVLVVIALPFFVAHDTFDLAPKVLDELTSAVEHWLS